jgi:phage shock protein PspC (stress-responsive transcriptional regulator)
MRSVSDASPTTRLPVPLSRARSGRWLAGVCAGLARVRGLPVGRLRAAFVLGALAGGLGVLVYLACWLIIPAEGEHGDTRGPREIVVLAQACAACAGLATLGAAGSAATVFGFGWAVVAIAAVILVAALAGWPRVGPGWALLPVAALALPSVALAAGGVRVAAQSGALAEVPRTANDIPRGGYRSGLGHLLVDLRHTALPASGEVPLRIDAGIRRTVVALPHDRCVHVDVRYHVVPFAARVASTLSGRSDSPFSEVTLFGMQRYGGDGQTVGTPDGTGPTLLIDFRSAGGSLYVRDYPDRVDPSSEVNWPGYPVTPEPRPDTTGVPQHAARRLVHAWRARHATQVRDAARIDRLISGPCAAPPAAAKAKAR